ncbi:NEAT domain-containing protein [Sporosarcina sp. E16_3]|uniref:NEAT domain-containing protein n=1 Tax=Sporosarcina sp. E16_3 TaxID=2789293 RepID=UPI001A936B6F|nr:NEAT domain-containing protein [Sporosarcina sp. E16_3]MBO0603164.1 NEAT domain-containing protein [Sporosarcina sp. E16_3]
MKKQLMMLFSALLVLFTVLPASQIEAAEVTTPVKQEFELPLDVLQVENDDKSATAQYVKSPAKIVVEDGKTFAYVTLLSSKWWQSLKVQTKQPGTFKETNFADAEVISEDKAADTRLVKFEVQDLSKELNAKIHIIVTGVPGLGEYDHSYDIRLKFDNSKTPVVPEVPVVKPETPATEALKDGAYTIDYKALHEEEDKESQMTRYIETPAALSVKDGKNLVTMTLKNNEQITVFQVEQGGKFVDTTVVKTDVEADTRVVEFEVADLSTVVNAKFTVFVAAANHTGNYTVRLAFDKDSAKAVKVEAPEAIKDGAYTIDYKALHEEEDKASSMVRYIETPAALSVKDGKNLVSMTLTNNEQITAFQVEQAGKFVDTTVVKTDVEANKRVVEFEVADLSTIINAKFTVFVAAANHTGNYTVRLAFDKATIKPVVTEEETPVEVVPVTFTDISNTWAKPYIESLASKQIVKGKTATTFAPNDQITRAQFAILLSRALELPKQDYKGTFSDVTKDMDWIVFEAEAASRAGIISVNDGKFRPNEAITRQQMATMIIRAIEYKDASVLEGVKNDVSFADAKDITAYAKTSVDLAAGLGIIGGKKVKGKDVFEPKANATRAHASKMVYYMLEKIQK